MPLHRVHTPPALPRNIYHLVSISFHFVVSLCIDLGVLTRFLPSSIDSAAAGKWRVIALTNNFSKSDADIIGDAPPPKEQFPHFTVQAELAFLGWHDGATPPRLRALFDDFCDSSTLGMRCARAAAPFRPFQRNGVSDSQCLPAFGTRPTPLGSPLLPPAHHDTTRTHTANRKPEPEIYRLACARNGIKPSEAVFLDDLGM